MEIKYKRGTKNIVDYHLSRIEGIKSDHVPINDDFPYERLLVQLELEISTTEYPVTYEDADTNEIVEAVYTKTILQWHADFVNYLVAGVLPHDISYQ